MASYLGCVVRLGKLLHHGFGSRSGYYQQHPVAHIPVEVDRFVVDAADFAEALPGGQGQPEWGSYFCFLTTRHYPMGLPAFRVDSPPLVSPDEYLRLEREAANKHEYYHGEIRAMAGARAAHNRLCFNLSGLLFSQLDGSPCEGYTSDQRVQVLNASSYLYPDLSVVCGEARFSADKKPESLLNPTLLVEVLSASTSREDRSEKFMLYRQLPSLRQYLMLDSQSVHAELYTRQDNDHWLYRETRDLATVLALSSIGAELQLARLYQGVQLEA